MIDNQTGVVHFDRFSRNKKHGECVRLWDDGTKWVSTLDFDRQTYEVKFNSEGKEINPKSLRVASKPIN